MSPTNPLAGITPGKSLSKNSEYENTFGTRYRGPGRPVDAEPVFPDPSGDTHPILIDIAIRRAYSVIHERHKTELTDVFLSELKVLRRRGLEQSVVDSCKQRAFHNAVDAESERAEVERAASAGAVGTLRRRRPVRAEAVA